MNKNDKKIALSIANCIANDIIIFINARVR